ncbi:hypothetical protein WKT02_03820 [Erysipelotrichaceae bacterium HCN-30851]
MLNKWKIRIMFLVLGSSLMGIGVVLSTTTALGADTVALLWDGMHQKFHISLGIANYIFTGFFLLLVLLFDRKQIGIGTIAAPLIQGIVMDFIIRFVPIFEGIVIRVIIMTLGIVILAIGSGISAAADIGKSPYVGFTFAMNKKYNWSLSIFRVILDLCCLIIGIVLGANLSVGPFISVFLMGPITEISCHKIKSYI